MDDLHEKIKELEKRIGIIDELLRHNQELFNIPVTFLSEPDQQPTTPLPGHQKRWWKSR